jgi:peptide/nickel transport system substrate-binding protein
MTTRKLSRREFLHVATAAVAGTAAASCAPPTPEIVEKIIERTVEVEKVVEQTVEVEKVIEQTVEVEKVVEKTVVVEVEKGAPEPPLLADRVASGALPPIDERLPLSPMVVVGRPAIGEYGGEVRMVNTGWNWFVGQYGWFCERVLDYSDIDFRTIIPNMLESWEASEDGKTFTFHMRKGMKWSDGAPMTTDDIKFYFEDFALNEELGWVSTAWTLAGETAEVEFLDEFSFQVSFVVPYPILPQELTRIITSGQDYIYPSHHMKLFHADYAEAADLQARMEAAGVDSWQGLFNYQGQWGVGQWMAHGDIIGFPSMSAWWVTEKDDDTALYLWERNPFYWKSDQAGNQLPYLDNIRIEYASGTEIITQKIIQGETDFVGPHDVSIARFPLYKENEPTSNYQVTDLLSCMTDRYVLLPQHTHVDKVLEEIANHPNFVKALSVAIDREEINQSLFYGMARMGQLCPMPDSKFFKQKYAEAWAQYDPDLANQLLDEMGLDQRDSGGFRVRPDGQRLTYRITHSGARVGVTTHEFAEMVVTFWRDVGVDASAEEIDESLYDERMENGQVDCGVWHADRCTDLLMPVEPQWFIPTGSRVQSQAWNDWYEADEEGRADMEAPPEKIQELLEWYDEFRITPSETERIAIFQRILDYLAENPLIIGTVVESPAPVLFNRNMSNLPRPKAPIGWDTYGVGAHRPEAFFYEGGVRA